MLQQIKLKRYMKIQEAIKQSSFKSNIDMAIVNLLFTSNWLRDHQKTFFANYDIKNQHYNVLRILRGRYPDAASPGEIKEVMLDKSPDLTRLIDKLVKQGLVERFMCEENRRKVDVFITDKGLSQLKDIDHAMKKASGVWSDKLSEDEAGQLSELLDKLRG